MALSNFDTKENGDIVYRRHPWGKDLIVNKDQQEAINTLGMFMAATPLMIVFPLAYAKLYWTAITVGVVMGIIFFLIQKKILKGAPRSPYPPMRIKELRREKLLNDSWIRHVFNTIGMILLFLLFVYLLDNGRGSYTSRVILVIMLGGFVILSIGLNILFVKYKIEEKNKK